MVKAIIFSLLAGGLASCTSLQAVRGLRQPQAHAAQSFHFEWQLSGHRAVAPLQVFDDGRRTWLQFAPGQLAPAIFAVTSSGEHLLQPQAQGDYQILDGVWPQLRLRGGRQQSSLRRLDATLADEHSVAQPIALNLAAEIMAQPADAIVPGEASVKVSNQASTMAASATASHGEAKTASGQHTPILPEKPELPQIQTSASTKTESPLFEVSPADLTLRAALLRWADLAGWTFLPEHWAVDVDIPLAGSAVFRQPFEGAVQELVASTELGDYPLQPCFYSNKVLRVVRYATPCDRMTGSKPA